MYCCSFSPRVFRQHETEFPSLYIILPSIIIFITSYFTPLCRRNVHITGNMEIHVGIWCVFLLPISSSACCLSVCLSIWLSISVCVYLSIYICLSICLSISVCLSAFCLSISVCLCLCHWRFPVQVHSDNEFERDQFLLVRVMISVAQ